MFMGAVIACYGITVANLTVGTNILNWTWIAWVVMSFELIAVFLYLIVYGSIKSVPDLYDYWRIIFANLNFWLGLMLVVVCCVAPNIGAKLYLRIFHPQDFDIVREMEVLGLPIAHPEYLAEEDKAEAVFLTSRRSMHGPSHGGSPEEAAHVRYGEDGVSHSSAEDERRRTTRRMSVYSTLSHKSGTYAGFAFDKTDPN